jgi:hypothetical protein
MALAVTIAIGVAVLYLAIELYRRAFFTYTDGDAVATLWGIVRQKPELQPIRAPDHEPRLFRPALC